MIHNAFPDDLIVGEEDAADLRLDWRRPQAENHRACERSHRWTARCRRCEGMSIGPGQALSPGALMDAIDRKNFQGGRTGRTYPVDFT